MIQLPTQDPNGLLRKIKERIDAKQIKTWTYDEDGDFTHSAEQWNQKAWLRPQARAGALVLFIVPPITAHITSEVYAVYHGRFIEMALRHFDSELSGYAAASPFPEELDRVAGSKAESAR